MLRGADSVGSIFYDVRFVTHFIAYLQQKLLNEMERKERVTGRNYNCDWVEGRDYAEVQNRYGSNIWSAWSNIWNEAGSPFDAEVPLVKLAQPPAYMLGRLD